MKTFAITIITVMIAATANAMDCQDLRGDFFFSHNPGRSMKIEQSGCDLTVTNATAGGQVGKPIHYNGEGDWSVVFEDSKYKESYSSTASANSYLFETKSLMKRTGVLWHHKEVYKLRADGDITVKSWITNGTIVDQGAKLLVRE